MKVEMRILGYDPVPYDFALEWRRYQETIE